MSSTNNDDKLIGMKAICQYLNISEATAIKWHREIDLPIKKACGIWIGSKEKIEKWIKEYLEK